MGCESLSRMSSQRRRTRRASAVNLPGAQMGVLPVCDIARKRNTRATEEAIRLNYESFGA